MFHWIATAVQTYILHPLTGNGYAWWSGAGSDLGEITLLAAIVALFRHHNCRKRGCWRLGHRHPDTGQPVCRKHFPKD